MDKRTLDKAGWQQKITGFICMAAVTTVSRSLTGSLPITDCLARRPRAAEALAEAQALA
jgi:hypothetical protein